MISFDAFARAYILRWEGSAAKGYLSLDPNDNGNWTGGVIGSGRMVGSNYGVTPMTLATFRGVPATAVTAADIKAVTIDVAVQIARKLFYRDPGLNLLSWNRVTASIVDFGWGAGPTTAKKKLQELLDLVQDGAIGPKTIAAYDALIARGEAFAAGAWWAMRERYYEGLIARRPSDAIYARGWDNRSAWFAPGHPEGWWESAA